MAFVSFATLLRMTAFMVGMARDIHPRVDCPARDAELPVPSFE
jgi:hypothetical protein